MLTNKVHPLLDASFVFLRKCFSLGFLFSSLFARVDNVRMTNDNASNDYNERKQ